MAIELIVEDADYSRLALAFADALASGRFEQAATMLAPALANDLTAGLLRANLERMLSYADSAPDSVELVSTLNDWPDKMPNDIGWAYVAIAGADFCEAVSVVVASLDGGLVVREVEWGRP